MLLPLLLSSACAAVPDLGPKPMPRAAASYESGVSLSPAETSAAIAAWPQDQWWARYGDAQLSRLIDEALAGSPDLAAAAARLRVAQGFAQSAGAALLPSVDAFSQGDFTKQNGRDWQDKGSTGLSLSFDLDLWGKNRAALAAATSDAKAAGFDFAEARLALTTAIAATYADLAQYYAQRDTLEMALAIRTDTARLVAQRVELGLDTLAERKQAEARVSQARADLAATDEAIGLTRNALAALVGKGPDRGLAIARPNVAGFAAQQIPANATIDLIGRRPDVAAARARVEANASRIKEARAAFYPSINITALLGFSALGLDNLSSQSSQFGSVSPAVSLPLFHGGALQGQYRGARGRYDEAVAQYDGTVVAALRETADAVTSRRSLTVRLADSRRALADFEEANRLARQRYAAGLSTYLDVLSAEEGVLAARLDVAQLETRAFQLDVALVRALGGGFAA
jgi:NodT family efflux transporter outer membrane factor (OMF) lipoprotein